MSRSDRTHDARTAVLFSFGNMVSGVSAVPADLVFQKLTERLVWYLPRPLRALEPGKPCIFYQSKKGVVASGVIGSIMLTESEDQGILASLGLHGFAQKVQLQNIRLLPQAIQLGPLANRLSFITNKKYWGMSLRFAARRIPRSDFDFILRSEP